VSQLQSEWRAAAKIWRGSEVDPTATHRSIGIAASFTANPLEPQLGAALLAIGENRPDIRHAEFNQVHQALIAPENQFEIMPDLMVVLWRIEDIFPKDIWAYIGGDSAAGETIIDGAREIAQMTASVARRCGVLVTLPPMPVPFGVDALDSRILVELGELHGRVRAAVVEELKDAQGVQLVDLDGLLGDVGRANSTDERKWLLYRQPFTEDFFHLLGNEVCALIVQRTRSYPKCIAIDCDNTLWGGVIGEDGIGGIELGTDFPGSAFALLQQQLLLLKRSGVLLAIVSKNDEPAVMEVFEKHPGMILKASDIAAWRVNWIPKSENLKSLSDELNFGLDAFVFLDDSNFEVAEVTNALPEVTVLQIPEEPADIPGVLVESGLFRNLKPNADDEARTERIQQESLRRTASAAQSPEDFLASLQLRVVAEAARPEQLARVTQLINKTNQFNLTTRRRDESEVAELMESDEHDLLVVSVDDRFGEYGLVGTVIVDRTDPETASIDTMLLSCRVLGRGVEFATLAAAAQAARDRGATTLKGHFLPTLKNGQVADFYPRAGFEPVDEGTFETDPATVAEGPAHIRLETENTESAEDGDQR